MLLFSRFIISGHSMEPTIKNGESVFATSLPYLFSKPKVGEIVVIKNKHPIRHSGERSDSRISSQNLKWTRRFWTSQNDGANIYLVKRIIKINQEKYFVKGDNEKDSLDSRRLGWIEKKDIVGKVVNFDCFRSFQKLLSKRNNHL